MDGSPVKCKSTIMTLTNIGIEKKIKKKAGKLQNQMLLSVCVCQTSRVLLI